MYNNSASCTGRPLSVQTELECEKDKHHNQEIVAYLTTIYSKSTFSHYALRVIKNIKIPQPNTVKNATDLCKMGLSWIFKTSKQFFTKVLDRYQWVHILSARL